MSQMGSVPSSEDEQPPSQPREQGKKRVRGQVKSACLRCRYRKTKCDGIRQSPKCTSCVDDATECTYVTREGEDRRAALIRRRTELEEERDQLNSLFRAIQTCPESVALDVFRCLRENPDESTAALARNIEAVIQRHAESQSQPSQTMDGIQEAESSIQKK